MHFLFRRLNSIARYRALAKELRTIKRQVNNLFRFETLINEIATRFINLSTEKYDEGINDLLRDIGEFVKVDRAYLFIIDDGIEAAENTREWCARGIESMMEGRKNFRINIFPWWKDRLSRNEVVHVSSLDDLPAEAAAERRSMAVWGVRSRLVVPLICKEVLAGFIGFDSVRTDKNWDDREIHLLRSVAQDIVNLRLRREAEMELRESRNHFTQLVTSIESVFFLFSVDLSHTIYVSPAYSVIWGKSEDSLREKPLSWLDAVHPAEKTWVESAFLRFPGGDESFTAEFRILVPGEIKWIALRAFKSENKGKASRIAAVAEDISRKKAAEFQIVKLREADLETSSRIQRTILIEEPKIENPGIDIASLSIPSEEVDGDFYNATMLSDVVFDLLVGDVMGKGLPGAFIAAAVRNQFLRVKLNMVIRNSAYLSLGPAKVVTEAALRICPDLINLDSFVTLIYAWFRLDSRYLDFVDCGHTPIMHFHSATGKCWLVKGKNLPLGFSETEHYAQVSIPFEGNDILFFYSDGISEARNQNGGFFGEERIVSVIEQNHEKSSRDIIGAMKNAVIDFAGGSALADDFTCVAVKMVALPGIEGSWYHGVFPNTICALQNIRDFIRNSLESSPLASLPQAEKEKIILVGHEAASNVIEHGIGREIESGFYLEMKITRSNFLLRYIYTGKSFPVWVETPEPKVESLQERGYGIFIMEQVMDSITYANDFRGGMMMTLVKRFDKSS